MTDNDTSTDDTEQDGEDLEDWIEYQQNEIDGAKEDIENRREHIGNYRQNGLLDGDFVNHRDNEEMKYYLQGYADALEFASERITRIDNLVKYAERHIEPDTERSDHP